MTAVPGAAFRDHLADLDRETATALVAAVYDARGWETERVDGHVRATPPRSDRQRRLVIRVGGAADASEPRPTDDADVVDAAALHEMVAYALPPDDRRRLCRRFFDRDPSAFGGRDAESEDDGDAADDDAADGDVPATVDARSTRDGRDADSTEEVEPTMGDDGPIDAPKSGDGPPAPATGTDRPSADRPEWLGRAAAVGVALSLVLGGLVAGTGPGVDVGPATAVLGGNETDTDATPSTEWPRGVDSTGVTDASALADTHEAALSNQSYRLEITYREVVDGELRGVAHERAVVASRDRYRSRVRRLGSVRHESTVIASGSQYANGSTGYVLTADGVRERTEIRLQLVAAPADSLGFTDRTERAVAWYLDVDDSWIVDVTKHDGTRTFRVAFAGDPWPESRNVTGWARVDENGLVREIHREYTPASEPDVRIEVTIRIVPEPVTVTRPGWLATNGTDGRPSPAGDRLTGGRA